MSRAVASVLFAQLNSEDTPLAAFCDLIVRSPVCEMRHVLRTGEEIL
jgi:hypothetical protein